MKKNFKTILCAATLLSAISVLPAMAADKDVPTGITILKEKQ